MVKIELGKRDFFWMGLIVILLGAGFAYSYGTSDPAVFGHSFGELSDCGDNEYLRGDGGCANASYIVVEGGGVISENCTVTTWVPATSTVCSGVSFSQLSNCGDSRTATGTQSCLPCLQCTGWCETGGTWNSVQGCYTSCVYDTGCSH